MLLNLIVGGFAKFKANNALANEIYMAEEDGGDEPNLNGDDKEEIKK